jgi:predicted metalloprotease with PDZ domain
VLVNIGEGGIWDGSRSAADVQRIVETEAAFWGQIPYDRYVFFNIISEARGGLEHKNSCTLMASRWQSRTRHGYIEWLTLVGHEYFHTWNVKRLRPVELGPFNYEQENYTRLLWVAEGLTSYYGDLLAERAGVITREEYLNELGGMIAELQTTPGRLSIPVEDASLDAWIRYYRPDENTPNTGLSYYTKGGVIGFLLDLRIRHATSGAKSLDDVMRLAYERFSGARGFTSTEFRAVISEVAGKDLAEWLHRALDTTDELEYGDIAWLGLRFKPEAATTRAWLGLTTGPTLRTDNGRLVVAQVRRGTPAFDAGVNVDDEILAVAGYRVRPDQWESRLEAFRPGDHVDLLVARRERVLSLPVTFAATPPAAWRLEADPAAPAESQSRMDAWLNR